MNAEADLNRAYNSAIRLLSRREHSVAELRGKLLRKFKGIDPADLDRLLQRLQEDNLLSDERFAESLIRSRTHRGYGPFFIQQELAVKGIDGELAQRLLEEADTDWLHAARDLITRRHAQAGDDTNAWGKAARYLQRRGFSGEVVIKALGDRPS